MVNITPNAVNDISDYYYNVMLQHPNTWDIIDAYNQVDKVIDEIENEANRIIKQLSFVHGQVLSPLLYALKRDGMVETFVKKSKWQFTLRFNESDNEYYVDNAVKGGNMSNRAYRHGVSNPTAPLSNDDRQSQVRMWESHSPSRLSLKELRQIIVECIMRALSEQQKQMLGNYEIMDGDGLEHEADSIIQFGLFNDIRMYFSEEDTYCLMRRCDNGTYFFTKIVDAPELGEKETKFEPVKPKDVPPIIFRDAQSLIRSSATLRNLLF